MPTIDPPLALLAELTHRCPLACPYCSNPVNLERAAGELSEQDWRRVLAEAAALGVLQVHFSGGEPMARRDLLGLIAAATEHGLYSNLITSGTLGGAREIEAFANAGLKHVQLSFQDFAPDNGDRIAGLGGAHAKKTRFAAAVRAAGLPLTLNLVVHRQNLDGVPDMIEMALALGARRLEIAHVQYYAWALANRAALLPSRRQLDEATAVVEAARERLKGCSDHRPCRAGLSRRAAEILHERLGPAVPERHAVRHGRALPCGRDAAGHRLPLGARPAAWPTSGIGRTPSTGFAAPTGWPSPAAAASGARSTGAAAAARPSCWPARQAAPTRSVRCRPTTAWSRPPCRRPKAPRPPSSIAATAPRGSASPLRLD